VAPRLCSGDDIFVRPGEMEVASGSPVKGKGKGKAKVVKVAKSEVWLARLDEIVSMLAFSNIFSIC